MNSTDSSRRRHFDHRSRAVGRFGSEGRGRTNDEGGMASHDLGAGRDGPDCGCWRIGWCRALKLVSATQTENGDALKRTWNMLAGFGDFNEAIASTPAIMISNINGPENSRRPQILWPAAKIR